MALLFGVAGCDDCSPSSGQDATPPSGTPPALTPTLSAEGGSAGATPAYGARCTSRAACLEVAMKALPESDSGCAEACLELGRCRRDGSRCGARGAADCASSLVCLLHGMCGVARGPCDDGEGTCRQCRVAATEDCRRSLACFELGQCTMAPPVREEPWAACVVGSDGDCRQSESCRIHGECTAAHGACVATAAADCRRSRACRDGGACQLVGESCVSESR